MIIYITSATYDYINKKVHIITHDITLASNQTLLLREFYSKQMDLSKTDEKEVQNVLELLNNRPRKCINYKTPQELFNEYLCECCT